jgi:hypothetical protein
MTDCDLFEHRCFVFREQESSAVPRPPTSPGTLESDYHMVSQMHSV